MFKQNSPLKRAAKIVGGIAIFVVVIIVYNSWLWVSEGSPKIPRLEGRWWAGYYETTLFGRQWCIARFNRIPSGKIQMALISPIGAPDIFEVDRDSDSQSFVHPTLASQKQPIMRVEAKQMYEGARYYFGRLIVGRFSDFWKMNEDISIRGVFVSTSPNLEFAIEPIDDAKLEEFWKRL